MNTTTQDSKTSDRPVRGPLPLGLTMARLMTAGAVVIGVLAVASPSWAGPMMGC